MMHRITLCVLCLWLGTALGAMELKLPETARALSERTSALDSYGLPTGVFAEGEVPQSQLEGRVTRRTWRISSPDLTTLQVLSPLRQQVGALGYEVLFDCDERECGGFDFRFAIEVVPAPDMYVDIRDYRFLAAEGPNGSAMSILVSRSLNALYVQVVEVLPAGAVAQVPVEAVTPEATPEPEIKAEPQPVEGPSLAEELMAKGHVILSDLAFRSGATRLSNGRYDSLEALAEHLKANPNLRVALVGHTDSVGALEDNIDLSRSRAESVRARLLEEYDLVGDRVEAQGMGYLSPIASNLTIEGREANRRVEVILLSNGR